MDTHAEIPPLARDDDMRAVWEAIRENQKDTAMAATKAVEAMAELKVHQAEHRGAQRIIDLKLDTIQGLLRWAIGGLGTSAVGIGSWALARMFGG